MICGTRLRLRYPAQAAVPGSGTGRHTREHFHALISTRESLLVDAVKRHEGCGKPRLNRLGNAATPRYRMAVTPGRERMLRKPEPSQPEVGGLHIGVVQQLIGIAFQYDTAFSQNISSMCDREGGFGVLLAEEDPDPISVDLGD